MREPVRWFFQKQASLIADETGVPPEQYKFYRRVRENLLSLADERHSKTPPSSAIRKRSLTRSVTTTRYSASTSSWARSHAVGSHHEKVRRSLELFADKVMPQFA